MSQYLQPVTSELRIVRGASPHARDVAAPYGVRVVRPLRVLAVASTFPGRAGDGTPGFVRDLCLGLAASGCDVRVVVPRIPSAVRHERMGPLDVRRFSFFPRRWEDLADGAILENLRERPVRWLQVPPFLVAEMLAIRASVREFAPDVLHAHWAVPQGVAAMVAAPRVPTVVTTHGSDVNALRDPLSRWVTRAVVRRAAALTVMNEEMRERVLASGAATETTAVMPMGVGADEIVAAARGVEPVPGRLVCVGRLVEAKGFAVLLDAFRLVDVAGAQLHVVGDGPLQEDLVRRARGLDVVFHGRLGREQVSAVVASAQLAVFPSIRASSGAQDGLPVSLLEAMTLGVATVASRLPGIDEAVVHGESGLLVPPGDTGALARAVTEVLSDDARRTRLSAAARRAARQRDSRVVGHAYSDLLHRVAGRRPV